MMKTLKSTFRVTSLLSAIIISKTEGAGLLFEMIGSATSSVAGKGTEFLVKKIVAPGSEYLWRNVTKTGCCLVGTYAIGKYAVPSVFSTAVTTSKDVSFFVINKSFSVLGNSYLFIESRGSTFLMCLKEGGIHVFKFLKSMAPQTKEEALIMIRGIPSILNETQKAVPLSTKALGCYIAYQHLKEKKTFDSKMNPILKEKEREHELRIQEIREEYKADPLAKTAADFQKTNALLERSLEDRQRELATVLLESEKRRLSEEKLKREGAFFQQEIARLSGELVFLSSSEDHIKDLQSKLQRLEDELGPLRKNEQKRKSFKRLHGERLLPSF